MKKILVLIMFLSLCLSNSAQNIIEENRPLFHPYNLRLGFSYYPKKDERSAIVPALRAELIYSITKYVETGLYVGMGIVEALIYKTPSTAYGRIKPIYYYGVNTNYHIVPLLFKNENLRFDGYITAKFGGHYCNIPKGNYPAGGNIFEYEIGLGAIYYFKTTLGAFAEFSYGYFDYFDENLYFRYKPVPPHLLRYGLIFKFRNRPGK